MCFFCVGAGTPKDRDEVNKREVCECDWYVCDLDVKGPRRTRNSSHKGDRVRGIVIIEIFSNFVRDRLI